MNNVTTKTTAPSSSQQELRRIISWAKDNPDDWYRICHMESCEPTVAYISDLVKRLRQAELYTLLYLVIFSNEFVGGVGGAIAKTMGECFLDTPVDFLVERFCNNMELKAKEWAAKPAGD